MWHTFLIFVCITTIVLLVNAFGNNLLPPAQQDSPCVVGFWIRDHIHYCACYCDPELPERKLRLRRSCQHDGMAHRSCLDDWTAAGNAIVSARSPCNPEVSLTPRSLTCFDAPPHLSEEIANPSKNVPRIMVLPSFPPLVHWLTSRSRFSSTRHMYRFPPVHDASLRRTRHRIRPLRTGRRLFAHPFFSYRLPASRDSA